MKNSTVRKSRGLRMLGLCLVLLGVCVFAWGLRYKLSLYDAPHSVGRHVPEAKLLTSRERSPMPVIDLRQAASLGAPMAGCTLLLLLIALLDAPARLILSWDRLDIFGDSSPPPLHNFSASSGNLPPPALL